MIKIDSSALFRGISWHFVAFLWVNRRLTDNPSGLREELTRRAGRDEPSAALPYWTQNTCGVKVSDPSPVGTVGVFLV